MSNSSEKLPLDKYIGIVEHPDGELRFVVLDTGYILETIIDPATGLNAAVGVPVYEPVITPPKGSHLVIILSPDERTML